MSSRQPTSSFATAVSAAGSARSRRIETIYGVLFLAGVVLPVSRFVPWLTEHGFDVPLFLDELFANRISAGFGWDVIVSVIALLILAAVDRELSAGQRLGMAVASLVGASSGLPLYLLLRERLRNRAA
jgi:Terpene cyclase DEP1